MKLLTHLPLTFLRRTLRNRSRGRFALSSLVFWISVGTLAQETSQILPFSGALPGQVDGSVAVRLRLFPASSGGTAVFTETQTVTVTSERFPVLIGAATTGGIPTSVFRDNASVWIAVSLDSAPGEEIGQRIAIYGAGYAFKAATAASFPVGALVSGSPNDPAIPALTVNNTNTGSEASAVAGNSINGFGVVGQSGAGVGVSGVATGTTGENIGVFGLSQSASGTGVTGFASASSGVTSGVKGVVNSPSGAGVFGYSSATTGATYGLFGQVISTSGFGVSGSATASTGSTNGVRGDAASNSGRGVIGFATATSGVTVGVQGETVSPDGRGMFGYAGSTAGNSFGVQGESASVAGVGVYGLVSAGSGTTAGVRGVSQSSAGRGLSGIAAAVGGTTYGVLGEAASPDGRGVYGFVTATTGNGQGVRGDSSSPDGRGVYGRALSTTGTAIGVQGQSESPAGLGVFGLVTATTGRGLGIQGESRSTIGVGVSGFATATTGVNFGVEGITSSPSGIGVIARSANDSSANLGLRVLGRAEVTGTLSKGAGSFRIDHPLDPENKFLQHSFVESPEMMNIYNGNVTLDANGEAWVELPAWFEKLNKDFRYQLTCLGRFAPVYVAEEIAGNRFRIAGGFQAMKVSWQVTGVRKDPFAERYRIAVEEDKTPSERGYYQHPEVYGHDVTKGIEWARNPEREKRLLGLRKLREQAEPAR